MRYYLYLFFLLMSVTGFGQSASVTGQVTTEDGQALPGAAVGVAGVSTGTFTDANGTYALSLDPGTYQLRATFVGYALLERELTLSAGQTVTLDFELAEGLELDQVVVSGSARPERITESPATIETIFSREILEYAGNPAELIARQKGVDYFRAGLAAPAFNIRGFNSNFNAKNLQVTDGRFSTLVATGLPFGPLNTTIKEDIEQVEIILGPNSTLYGPNAHNGLLNTITKDPRRYPGTMVTLNPGITGDGDAYFSARVRHAQALNDRWAFKVTGEYTKGTEFDYVDSVYIDRRGGEDEEGNAMPDGIKEGYEELELDRDVEFLRGEFALHYDPSDQVGFQLKGGLSNSTYLSATNVGRNQIKDWRIGYLQLRASGEHWFAQVYYTASRTDSTYSIDDRTKQYYRLLDAGQSEAVARGPLSYATGALFQDASERWNAEAQYYNSFGELQLVGGVQYQLDRANSRGTYLLDENDDDYISVNQIGAYAHLTYDFGGGWRALAAARADNHEIYDFNLVPKLGLLRIGERGTWRLTYGQGIAAPTILNMFGNLFGGLILGNAEGFTLADGSMVNPQQVEKISTFELGYRGQLEKDKLFLDANAYYSISKDFLSPVTVVGVTTHRGDTPTEEVQDAFAIYQGLVATYINFGQVNTYGFDVGLNYYFTPQLNGFLNYSYFDYGVDEDDPGNDFNKDGTVNFLDVLVNAPTHKVGAGLSYSGDQWFGSLFGRWVQAYDYFSSFQIASRSHPGISYRGTPIVENARSTDSFNYGPLGGFVTFDANVGYRFSERVSLSVAANNLFNTELREFTASAPTRGLYTLELRFNLPPRRTAK
ncbi:TonB-dependent receptor [Lewinella sp. JB7]|uniref:TonB-dependent receptor n=1 Tax=Lewinella sp. JB7 TaxID=2962887 RepID=UPI0020C97A70|nr:TonB-dependent receptor [Lewinella sp. JB7]MCP9234973.1 TonB-dependent receptor [Lewinella sp. JB7]